MIWPTTPTGSRSVYARYSPGAGSAEIGTVLPWIFVGQPAM